MSLFSSIMGEFDDNSHLSVMQARNMNRFMGSLLGLPKPLKMNRLLSADVGANGGSAYCSSRVISMSSGPDGRPQIYQATTSTINGPGGVREVRKTVQDSRTGVKKIAIGHQIDKRAHIIEKEENLRSGEKEERQEFINLDEDEAEDFDQEFLNRATLRYVSREMTSSENEKSLSTNQIQLPSILPPTPYKNSVARRKHLRSKQSKQKQDNGQAKANEQKKK